jgi:cobalt transporter subunit CbtA
MITRVLSAGLLAGLVAGLAIALLQNFTTTPLIIEAETYENAAPEKSAFLAPAKLVLASADASSLPLVLVHGPEGHGDHGEEAWAPADGAERIVYTSIATVGASVGFAFLLLAGMLIAGERIDERQAMIWAAAGFVATGLAPAVGLSPELPGMPAADLVARQGWWLLTALSTAAAIWLFLRNDSLTIRALAVALLLAPHVIGAPHLAGAEVSKVPAELAARFAAMSLAVHAALWIATGFAVGAIWPRLAGVGASVGVAKT